MIKAKAREILDLLRPIYLENQVRIGSTNDGGYVLPQQATVGVTELISLGYGHNADFENDFLRLNPTAIVRLYESSINLRSCLVNLLNSILQFFSNPRAFPDYRLRILIKYLFLRSNPRIKYFYQEVVPTRKDNNRQITLSEILDTCSVPNLAILKVDIEGAEFETLRSVLYHQNFRNLRCMVIEFHKIFENEDYFRQILNALATSHSISNSHFNNFAGRVNGIPDVVEITFVTKSFSPPQATKVSRLPNFLDKPCNPNESEFTHNYN